MVRKREERKREVEGMGELREITEEEKVERGEDEEEVGVIVDDFDTTVGGFIVFGLSTGIIVNVSSEFFLFDFYCSFQLFLIVFI